MLLLSLSMVGLLAMIFLILGQLMVLMTIMKTVINSLKKIGMHS